MTIQVLWAGGFGPLTPSPHKQPHSVLIRIKAKVTGQGYASSGLICKLLLIHPNNPVNFFFPKFKSTVLGLFEGQFPSTKIMLPHDFGKGYRRQAKVATPLFTSQSTHINPKGARA